MIGLLHMVKNDLMFRVHCILKVIRACSKSLVLIVNVICRSTTMISTLFLIHLFLGLTFETEELYHKRTW